MVTIISVFDKNEDFIKLQYESILKHVKGDYEYIIFNNGSNSEQANKIKEICDELNINNIRITVNYAMDPSNIAGEALNQSFKYLTNKQVFKLDSDMFFMHSVELSEICNTYDLVYVENVNMFMWSGIFGLNMEKVKGVGLDFRPNVIPSTDTFGQSCLITSNMDYTRKKIQLFTILTKTDNVIRGLINGDCSLTLDNYNLTFKENNRYDHLDNELPAKYLELTKMMLDYGFPNPYHIDIITIDGENTIIHFKCANHDPLYDNLDYTKNKKTALINFLNDN